MCSLLFLNLGAFLRRKYLVPFLLAATPICISWFCFRAILWIAGNLISSFHFIIIRAHTFKELEGERQRTARILGILEARTDFVSQNFAGRSVQDLRAMKDDLLVHVSEFLGGVPHMSACSCPTARTFVWVHTCTHTFMHVESHPTRLFFLDPTVCSSF